MARPYSPVDDDLQGLYDEVWASFAEEAPVVHQQLELDSGQNDPQKYLVHGQSGPVNSPKSCRQHDDPVLHVSNHLDCVDPHPTVSTTTFKHPQEALPVSPGRPGARPLPPTPGSPSSATSPATFRAMPEPEPYYEPSAVRTGHHTGDSYGSSSSDLRRKATTASAKSRQFAPPTPISSPRPPPDNGVYTGPTEPIQSALPRTMSHSSYGSSNGTSYPDSLSRESSYRPSGAPPSSVPGVQGVDNNLPPATDGRSINSGDWYHQEKVHPFENNSSMSWPSGGTGIPGGLQNQPNQEYMAQVRQSPSFTALSGDTSNFLLLDQ